MSRLRLVASLAIALVLLLPATALAATYDVSGTVTDTGGAPVAGVEVTILVQGTDIVLAATSDANGAWGLQVDADPGAVLEVNATGPTSRSDPDDKGCVTSTTMSGQVTAELPAEGQPDAVALVLDRELTGKVCAVTAKPDKTDSPVEPQITPPSTDTAGTGAGSADNRSLLLVGSLLGIMGLALSTAATRRRATAPVRSTRR